MSIGTDGFTDCNYVCNPVNYMKSSCNDYCKGFSFLDSTPDQKDGQDFPVKTVVIFFSMVFGIILLSICYYYKDRIFTLASSLRDRKPSYPTQESTPFEDTEAGRPMNDEH